MRAIGNGNGNLCRLAGRGVKVEEVRFLLLGQHLAVRVGRVHGLQGVNAVELEVIGEGVKNQVMHLCAAEERKVGSDLGDAPVGQVRGCVVLFPTC